MLLVFSKVAVPILQIYKGSLSKQCYFFLHCPYYMFNGCSYPTLWDGRKKLKLFWRNLCCCCHFSCRLHTNIASRSSPTLTYGAHFRITFMEDCISFTIKDFISLHYLHSLQISYHGQPLPSLQVSFSGYFHCSFHFGRHRLHSGIPSDVYGRFHFVDSSGFVHSTSYFHHKNHTTDFISLHFVLSSKISFQLISL